MKPHKVSKRNVFYAAIATAAEYYDFTLFAYVAIYISHNFFPSSDPTIAMLSAFGMFASGYIMRPLGGIILGNMGDKYGRKYVLKIAMFLMMLSVLIIAFVPTTSSIGITAVILMVLARMIQGFSIGGEYNGVLALLVEQAPRYKRASITSWGTFIEGNGVLLSTIVVFLCTYYFTSEQMYDFGWRIPYYVGFALVVFAFLCILRLKESEEFKEAQQCNKLEKVPVLTALKEYPLQIMQVFFLAGYLGIAYYMAAAFIPSFLVDHHFFNENDAMLITMIAAVFYAYSAPFWGRLSDKIGRKPMLLGSSFLLGLLCYPLFMLLTLGSLFWAGFAYCIFMLLIAAGTATFVTAINELFPTHLRFSGVATGYNVSNAIFGGTTPLVAGGLIALTAWDFAPSIYLIIASIVVILVVLTMKETNGIDLSL